MSRTAVNVISEGRQGTEKHEGTLNINHILTVNKIQQKYYI